MVTAKEKFQLGQQVKPTALAHTNLGERWSKSNKGGVVTGFNRNQPHVVLVKAHHRTSSSEFHMDFWEADA